MCKQNMAAWDVETRLAKHGRAQNSLPYPSLFPLSFSLCEEIESNHGTQYFPRWLPLNLAVVCRRVFAIKLQGVGVTSRVSSINVALLDILF